MGSLIVFPTLESYFHNFIWFKSVKLSWFHIVHSRDENFKGQRTCDPSASWFRKVNWFILYVLLGTFRHCKIETGQKHRVDARQEWSSLGLHTAEPQAKERRTLLQSEGRSSLEMFPSPKNGESTLQNCLKQNKKMANAMGFFPTCE